MKDASELPQESHTRQEYESAVAAAAGRLARAIDAEILAHFRNTPAREGATTWSREWPSKKPNRPRFRRLKLMR